MPINNMMCPYCEIVIIENDKEFERHLLENKNCNELFHESMMTCNHQHIEGVKKHDSRINPSFSEK